MESYVSVAGSVFTSSDFSHSGGNSLKVWANRNMSCWTNHVIGQKKLYNNGLSGLLSYGV
jgi:hypothetical protein